MYADNDAWQDRVEAYLDRARELLVEHEVTHIEYLAAKSLTDPVAAAAEQLEPGE